MAAGMAERPPVATTPIKANCEAPENMTRLKTIVCQSVKPNATDNAPKAPRRGTQPEQPGNPARGLVSGQGGEALNHGSSWSFLAVLPRGLHCGT